MNTSEITTSERKNPADVSSFVEKFSYSSSPQMLSFLQISQYLSLAAFVCVCLLSFVFRDNQSIFICIAVSLSVFIFLFFTNKQLFQNYKQIANQLEVGQKAELYTALLNLNNSVDNQPINRAREKALIYCRDLIEDYKKTRETARNIYYTFQLATVILSGVTPILVLVDKLEAGQAWLKWLPVLCPAIASIVASIVTSFPFQENWISANTTVELLEAEQEKFILGVTPAYRCYDIADETQLQQKAKMAIENFIDRVNEIHLKQIQKPDEKQSREQNTQPAQSTESTSS
ncbi:DUF4231 domain-containing protein [Microcoleus sp. D3_18a_C4]|uniref:DUF4231 domain-containing protein n=1 Tax=Microcoleus sp. D3_18a_C4 TaxID=3055332 RepID=UPI002FD072D1